MPAALSSSYLVSKYWSLYSIFIFLAIYSSVIPLLHDWLVCFYDQLVFIHCSLTIISESDKWNHINHSLDTWHKSKKILEGLGPESKKVRNRGLRPWLRSVVNHFWWACQACRGNKERLRQLWLSILGHVCNVHTWATGKCAHPLPAQPTDGKTWMDRKSPAYTLLRWFMSIGIRTSSSCFLEFLAWCLPSSVCLQIVLLVVLLEYISS